jgi:protein-L-isoaspartate O-methyltransferase
MSAVSASGTEGYADEAEAFLRQYESLSIADVHRQVMHLIPTTRSKILDIGAGTGRDAAGFAAMGHRVTAVEPTAELRVRAGALHPSRAIEWLDGPQNPHVRLQGWGIESQRPNNLIAVFCILSWRDFG